MDPSPLSPWPNNYGVWVDEFEALGFQDCFHKTWPMASVYLSEQKVKYLDRPYAQVLTTQPNYFICSLKFMHGKVCINLCVALPLTLQKINK